MLGEKHGRDFNVMIADLASWANILNPYRLIIEAPFIMGSQVQTIELTARLIQRKKEARLPLLICVDEWCNTLEDVERFKAKLVERSIKKMPEFENKNFVTLFYQASTRNPVFI